MALPNVRAGAPSLPNTKKFFAVVAAYAASFVMFGLFVQPPVSILRGLGEILTTRDALLTDYFGVGGIGGGCVSAGLLTWRHASSITRRAPRVTGAPVACLFLVLGFGLFGKNLNSTSGRLSEASGFTRNSARAFHEPSSTRRSSARLWRRSFGNPVRDLAVAGGQSAACPRDRSRDRFHPRAAAAHLFRAHMGFSLYNMGFAAGIVGTVVVAVYKAYGFVPDPVFIWTKGLKRLLGRIPGAIFRLDDCGRLLIKDPEAFPACPTYSSRRGRAPSDFIASRVLADAR